MGLVSFRVSCTCVTLVRTARHVMSTDQSCPGVCCAGWGCLGLVWARGSGFTEEVGWLSRYKGI